MFDRQESVYVMNIMGAVMLVVETSKQREVEGVVIIFLGDLYDRMLMRWRQGLV